MKKANKVISDSFQHFHFSKSHIDKLPKAGYTDGYLYLSRAIAVGSLIVCLGNLFGKCGNAVQILKRFGGQAVHKVKLNGVLLGVKGDLYGAQNILFAYVLVNDVT